MSKTRKNLTWTMALVVLSVAGVILWKTAETGAPFRADERRTGLTAETDETDTQTVTLPDSVESIPAGELWVSVSAPKSIKGYSAVLVATAKRSLRMVPVEINGDPVKLKSLPDEPLYVGPFDNSSAGATIRELHDACVWPGVTTLALDPSGPGRHVEVRFEAREVKRRLTIRVEDDLAEPVSNVTIQIDRRVPGCSIPFTAALPLTDEAGEVVSPRLGPGEYHAHVVADRNVSKYKLPDGWDARLDADQSRDLTFVLTRILTGSIRGQITPLVPGEMRCSLMVSAPLVPAPAPRDAVRNASSDEHGVFGVTDLLPGEYAISTWKNGYLPAYATVTVTAGNESKVLVRLLRGGATVRGRVLGADGKVLMTPHMNINRKMETGSAPAAAPLLFGNSGQFRAAGLPPGEYRIILWSHHVMLPFIVGTDAVQLGDITIPKPTGDRSVRGRVVDHRGQPVPLARVALQSAASDSDGWARFAACSWIGEFTLPNVAPGRYRIWFELTGIARGFDEFQPVEITVGDEDVTFDLHLRRQH